MKYYIVDAFSDKPFGGNPAGVVLLEADESPEERLMLQVAVELRYSETAFVRRLSQAAFHLRYFTPTGEVDLCGHATIATFSLLHSLGLADGRCRCHTMAGNLGIEAGERILMEMASPKIVKTIDDSRDIYKALGLDGYRPELPVQVAYAGLEDIMIPVPDKRTLNTLQPDMAAVADISRTLKATSFHIFALTEDYTAHVRDFAPLCGIPEESATGTANAALTHYLAVNGIVPRQGDFEFLQGEAMGRPSKVATRIAPDGTIYVGGTAAIVAEGNIL